MSNLFSNVKEKLYHLQGVSLECIIDAEKKLGLHFHEEFRNYIIEYGIASFGSHEFMGLGGDNYINVVYETINERKRNPYFPSNCYIVENIGIDNILILQDEEGIIYELSNKGKKKIFNSLQEYISTLS